MKRTRAYGVARTRSREGKGEIEKITLPPDTMCIHTRVGWGWKTMEVLVAEEYEEETR